MSFIERIYYQLNNDFEALLTASTLLADTRVTDGDRSELIGMVTDKIQASVDLMRNIRSHFKTQFSPVVVERFPIRFDPVLLRRSRPVWRRKLSLVTLVLMPMFRAYIPLVMAAPEPLGGVFTRHVLDADS